MRLTTFRPLAVAACAVASLGSGATADTAADVLEKVNGRLEREFISAEGLLLDYVGDIPDAREIAENRPNAMGVVDSH